MHEVKFLPQISTLDYCAYIGGPIVDIAECLQEQQLSPLQDEAAYRTISFPNTGRKHILEIIKITLPEVTNNHFPQYNEEIPGLFSMIKPLTGWHPCNKHQGKIYW